MPVRLLRLMVLCVVVSAAGALAAALALASSSKGAGTREGGAAAAAVTVWAGPPQTIAPPHGISKQADVLAFFPGAVTITAGQSVSFQFSGFHTVTFTGGKKTSFITPTGSARQPLLNDVSGEPMWWVGKAPLLGLNPAAVPQVGGATISSVSQIRSSGVGRIFASGNKPPKAYTLTFSKPGNYRFVCLVHEGMRGVIHVLPSTATAPSPDVATAAIKSQAVRVIADLRRIQSKNPTEPRTVWVGTGKLDGAEVTSFYPRRLVVNTGDTVKFVAHDPADSHTVTFGPAAYTGQIEKTFVSAKGINPFGAFPSEPPGPPAPITYDGANHGNGYINSGILNPYADRQPAPHLIRVTFTRPGTYNFECVIHPNMDGTIVVR